MKQKLGESVRARRKELGLTQAQLAAKAGTTQQTISNVERGISESARELVAIAKALGVRAETLEGFGSTDYVDRIHELIESRSPEDQEKAYNLLKVFLGED